MTDNIQAVLDGYITEALTLRFEGDMPGTHADPQQILTSLMQVRQRLDRVEELLGKAIRVKARAHRLSALATAAAEESWDRAAMKRRTSAVTRGDEYSSARERHAEANLSVLDDRHAAARASELAQICDEAVDVLRLTHRGLESVRQDHFTVLRAIQMESNLDR